MAKTRVHDLAKEYGISSKEMLEHLRDMKIPAKSASSTLEDAYVSIVRKKLKPILEAHAAEIEAQKRAEEEAKAEEARIAAEKAEAERIAAEERRERERAEEERRRAAAEAERKAREEARAEAERKAKEEAEKHRVRDNAPKSVPSFSSLLDQIAQQEQILKQQAEESAQKKASGQGRGHERGGARRSDSRPRVRLRRPGPRALGRRGRSRPSRQEGPSRRRGRGSLQPHGPRGRGLQPQPRAGGGPCGRRGGVARVHRPSQAPQGASPEAGRGSTPRSSASRRRSPTTRTSRSSTP